MAQSKFKVDAKQIPIILTAGLITGIIAVVVSISLATLIFSGELSEFVPQGIGLFLFGSLAMGIVVTFLGSLPGTIISPQDSPAAVLALAAGGIAAAMTAASAAPDAVYATVLAAIILSALFTGLAFYLIGQFNLGNLVRFIPYPVIGGFLAGTGWLLARGALEVMTGQTLGLAMLPSLFRADMLMRWLPGTIYAFAVYAIFRKFNHYLIWPGVIAGGLVIFYTSLFASGTSIEQARGMGLLMESFQGGGLWRPFPFDSFSQIDWPAILGQADKIVLIAMVSIIGFLLNATALELIAKRDIDLNHELRVVGISNLVAGLGGGPAGYHLLGDTSLAYRMGGNNRWVSLAAALFCGFILLIGGGFIGYLPVALLSGLLLMLGLSFLGDWIYDAWFKLPRSDYFIVLVSLVVIAAVGFLEGIAVGVAIATVLFVFKYSRVNTVRDTLNGTIYHSNVDRPAIQRQMLKERGEGIHIFRLQGYIFFGTSDGLLNRVREILEDKRSREHFIVLDFHRVHGLDSSAVSSFTRMRQLADLHDIYLVLTQVAPQIRAQMAKGGFDGDARVQFFPTLDHGVEWCENMLLTRHEASTEFIQTGIKSQLQRGFPHPDLVEPLIKYLERLEAESDFTLMKRGDPPDEMYFIEAGRLNIQISNADGEVIRLRSVRSGTVVGEMGMYLKGARSADVVTSQPSVLYRLTSASLKEMEERDPQVAAALHEWIARLLAERLADNNRAIEALMD